VEEQKARAESAETRLDALERRESSRLSTVQADAAAGQQELAQSRQRQEKRAQTAEAKLEELDLQYAQYAQELLERGTTREDELSRQLAEERTLRGKLRDVRQDDPKIQGQKQKVIVTQQDVDEEFERIKRQQDLKQRADRSIEAALEPSTTVRPGPPRSQAQGRKKGPKRAPSGKPGD
jgi:DNA repair exonuclease SbcCD ATPase subunit